MLAVKKDIPKVTPKEETSVIVQKDVPVSKAIYAVEGNPVLVNYFNQILAEDDTPRPFDENASPALQQYSLIKDFVMYMTESINETGSNTALIVNGVVPHVGDMFTNMDLMGVNTLYRITEIETRYNRQTTMYEVTFVIDTKENVNPNRYNAIKHFIVDTFNQVINTTTMEPKIIRSDDMDILFNYEDKIIELTNLYLAKYLDPDTNYLVIKENGIKYSDITITNLFKSYYTGEKDIRVIDDEDIDMTILSPLLFKETFQQFYKFPEIVTDFKGVGAIDIIYIALRGSETASIALGRDFYIELVTENSMLSKALKLIQENKHIPKDIITALDDIRYDSLSYWVIPFKIAVYHYLKETIYSEEITNGL